MDQTFLYKFSLAMQFHNPHPFTSANLLLLIFTFPNVDIFVYLIFLQIAFHDTKILFYKKSIGRITMSKPPNQNPNCITRKRLLLFTFALCIFTISILHAQCDSIGWSNDPSVNLNVSPWGQFPHAVSDGDGGVYILWNTNSPTTFQYLQRVDRCGIIQWATPVVIRGEWNGTRFIPDMAEDGFGGALVAYTEWEVSGPQPWPARVRVNRIDQDGNLQWGAHGAMVSLADSLQYLPQVVPDGTGGAIVSFGIPDDSLYLQRLSANGQPLWGNEGIFVKRNNLNFDNILISDKQGGAIVQWLGVGTGFKRYDSQGNELWYTPSPNNNLFYSKMLSNGAGGAVMSGTEPSGYRSVIANRISPGGVFMWGNMGIILSDSVGLIQRMKIALENNGTATFVWTEQPDSFTIFAQRVNSNGQKLWAENMPVSLFPSNKLSGNLVLSDNGNIIFIWADSRNGNGDPFKSDVFAQKLDSMGNRLWPSEDVAVSFRHPSALILISDKAYGAIVVYSNEPLYGIFAQQISKNGDLGDVITSIKHKLYNKVSEDFMLYQNYPNPFNSSTVISFGLAALSDVKLKIYDALGQEVKKLISEKRLPGFYSIEWDGDNDDGNPVSSGIYYYRLKVDDRSKTRKMLLIR